MNIYIYIYIKKNIYVYVYVYVCMYWFVKSCIYTHSLLVFLYEYILRQFEFDNPTPFGGSMYLTMHACAHTAWAYCSFSAVG